MRDSYDMNANQVYHYLLEVFGEEEGGDDRMAKHFSTVIINTEAGHLVFNSFQLRWSRNRNRTIFIVFESEGVE